MMTELLRGIGAAAYVQNLAAARRFYEGLLGLEIGRVMSRETREIAVEYKVGLSIWQVDDAYNSIFGPTSPRPAKLGCSNWEYSFETSELEALAARLEQAGVGFAQKLQQLPWGSAPSAITTRTGTSSISAPSIGARGRDNCA